MPHAKDSHSCTRIRLRLSLVLAYVVLCGRQGFDALFFVDVPEPNDTQPSTRTSLTPNPSSNNRAARESTLTPPLEIEEAEGEIKEDDVRVDWYAEASRVAADVIRRLGEQEKIRSFDAGPAGTAEAFAP